MKEAFNGLRIQKIADRLNLDYSIVFDIMRKRKFFAKLKTIKPIFFTEDIFKTSSDEDKEIIYSTFFPLKRESLRNSEVWQTQKFKYNASDEKIHWIVNTSNEGERHFKLKTSNFEDRIPEIVNKWKEKLKKEIDGLYGYWITDENYITDRNFGKNGFRLLCDLNHYNKNSFATPEEWECIKYNLLSC